MWTERLSWYSMGMYDNIQFQDGFSTEKPIPNQVLTSSWGQTKQLFQVLDFYQFRDQGDDQYVLCRMFPPLSRTDEEYGNHGSVSDHIKGIDNYNSDVEEYAEWWTPIRSGTGYLRVGMNSDDYMYEFFALIDQGRLEEIVPHFKTRFNGEYNEERYDDEYLMNKDRVSEILDNQDPPVC